MRLPGAASGLVDDLLFFRLEVWNLHRAHDFDCEGQRLFGGASASLGSNVPPCLSQFSQHLRTIKTLTLAVFAEAHDWPSTSDAG
jgi:hypothetical protein